MLSASSCHPRCLSRLRMAPLPMWTRCVSWAELLVKKMYEASSLRIHSMNGELGMSSGLSKRELWKVTPTSFPAWKERVLSNMYIFIYIYIYLSHSFIFIHILRYPKQIARRNMQNMFSRNSDSLQWYVPEAWERVDQVDSLWKVLKMLLEALFDWFIKLS